MYIHPLHGDAQGKVRGSPVSLGVFLMALCIYGPKRWTNQSTNRTIPGAALLAWLKMTALTNSPAPISGRQHYPAE